MKNTEIITLNVDELMNITEIVMQKMMEHPNSRPEKTTIKLKRKTSGEIDLHINGRDSSL